MPEYITIQVWKDHATPVGETGDDVLVTNVGGDTIYYGDRQVTPTQNLGSLTFGQSVTLTAPGDWVRSGSLSEAQLTTTSRTFDSSLAAKLGSDGFVGGSGGSPLTAAVDSGSFVYGGAAQGVRTALKLRDLLSVCDTTYGGVADFNMTGNGITISGGSLNQGTMTTIPADLVVGKTMIIAGLTAPVVVQSINAGTKTLTFTGNASGAVSGVMCAWGTDNTAAFNSFFSDCLTTHRNGIIPAGPLPYLITGTIGRPDGPTIGYSGVSIVCGGGTTLDSARLSTLGLVNGTTIVWGGVAGGTMMQWDRVACMKWLGGMNLVGQPSWDSSGFKLFGNRAGLGYHITQNGSPFTGTGYHHHTGLTVEDMSLGVQFGENSSDNNCDTTRFDVLLANRCSQAMYMLNQESIAHTFGFVQLFSCGRGISTSGGHLSIQQLNASEAGLNGSVSMTLGSLLSTGAPITSLPLTAALTSPMPAGAIVTTNLSTNTQAWTLSAEAPYGSTSLPVNSQTPGFAYPSGSVLTSNTYQLECLGGVSGIAHEVGIVRGEGNSGNLVLVGPSAACKVGIFHDEGASGTATGQKQAHVQGGGLLHISTANVVSFNSTFPPFVMDAAANKTGKLIIDDLVATGAGGIPNLSQLFSVPNANAVTDLTVRGLRDFSGNTYNSINTKFDRGKVYLYSSTSSAAASASFTFFGTGQPTGVTSYSLRVPLGLSIINIGIAGDRAVGTSYSYCQRQIIVSRASSVGAVTVIAGPTTVGTDSFQGTDAVGVINFTSTTGVLNITMAGTASTSILWTATVDVSTFTRRADL